MKMHTLRTLALTLGVLASATASVLVTPTGISSSHDSSDYFKASVGLLDDAGIVGGPVILVNYASSSHVSIHAFIGCVSTQCSSGGAR